MTKATWLGGAIIVCLLCCLGCFEVTNAQEQDEDSGLTLSLGELNRRDHGVSGEVVLLSETAIEIRNFSYDGAAPDAYFWVDANPTPTRDGLILSDGSPIMSCGYEPLTSRADGTSTYRVEFPIGTSIYDFLGGSISIWCKSFDANFGEVMIPTTLLQPVDTIVPSSSSTATTSSSSSTFGLITLECTREYINSTGGNTYEKKDISSASTTTGVLSLKEHFFLKSVLFSLIVAFSLFQ